MKKNHSLHKALFIGLDAADWDLISEKIASGKLPHLHRLIKRGASGPLRSLRPLFSPALWATISTGKRPYQHGITGFVLPTLSGRGLRTYDSSSRSAPAIWEILSSEHLTSNIVGWWNSAPAEKIHGIMVDETFRVAYSPCNQPWELAPTSVTPFSVAQELAPCRVHPQQLSMSLLQRLIPKLYEIDPTVDWRLSAIAKILAEDLTTLQTTLHLMKHHPADFTSLYLIGLDSFSHQGTSFREPITTHADQLGIEHYGELIDHAYDLYDEWIGMLVTAAGEETTIVLASDHGFYHDDRKPLSLGMHMTAPCDQHAPIGTLIIVGPNIQTGVTITHATLLDLCPTLLSLFQLPIGRDMKGHVLSQIFKTPPTLEHQASLRSVASWDPIIPRTAPISPSGPPGKATEMALRQLVALGYLPQAPLDHQQIIANAHGDHLLYRALSYLENDRIDAALPLLEEAHYDAPERTDILTELAHAYQMLGANEEAAALLKKLVYHRRRDAWQAYQTLQTKNYDPQQSLSTVEILEWRHLATRVQLDNEAMHFLLIFADWLVERHEQQARELQEFAVRRPHDFAIVTKAAEASLFYGWSEQGLSLLQRLADWNREESLPLVMMSRYENQHGHFQKAQLLSEKALMRYSLDYSAWLALGEALAGQAKWQEARKAALQAVESFLQRPQAYQLLATIARHEGEQSLSLRYDKLSAHASGRLSRLVDNISSSKNRHLHQERDPFSQIIEHGAQRYYSPRSAYQQPIVVTGLPRSGTSLLMQMLIAGGIDAITDHQRRADEHNPLGYFEHEKIKEIGRYPDLLRTGRAAKVVIPLLWDLPRDLECHVILIRRPLEEVIASQQRMAGEIASLEELKKAYIYYEVQTSDILRQRPWSVLQLSHTYLLADPEATAKKMNDFLGGRLNVKAMAAVVQPSLHRIKKNTQ